MKKLVYILAVIMLIGLLPIAACQTGGGETRTPILVKDMGHLLAEEPAPDDILPAPGGSLYRANIQQEGVENLWLPIEGAEIVVGSGSNAANIVYRDYIETKAGEARNNVIQVKIPSKEVKSLSLYTVAIPYGISLTVDSIWSGIPGTQEAVLVIEIAPDVSPGEYPLEIGLVINGKDYGTLICTIRVIEETDQPMDSFRLDRAMPYLVVGEGNLASDDPSRSVALWFITSENASGFEEYAQTAIQAAIDLYSLYRNDFTDVLLIPQQSVKTTYAQAFYASDGKGAWGMTGSVPAVPKYWHARAMDDLPYNPQELAILELWQEKQFDFPSQNPLSSLSYDETGLRQYIADTLHIPYSETQVRQLKTAEYKVPEESLGEEVPLRMPLSEAALQALISPFECTAAEKASIEALVNKVPEEIKSQFAMKYAAAEEVSKDSRWMAFSSWRPYTQSSEYQQLLEFCQGEGQAVWPLLFQQLDSENPHFAGGLILDVTLPEYLYYFGESGRQNTTEMEDQGDMLSGKPDLFAYTKELLALFQGGNHEK